MQKLSGSPQECKFVVERRASIGARRYYASADEAQSATSPTVASPAQTTSVMCALPAIVLASSTTLSLTVRYGCQSRSQAAAQSW